MGVCLVVLTPLVVFSAGFFDHSVYFHTVAQANVSQPQGFSAHSAQSMPLLRGVAGVRPQALGGGDILVDEDGSLVPTLGPDAGGFRTKSNGEISEYVVREGDSLSVIAEMFGVSVNTILWANEVKSVNAIRPGDTLVILPVSGVRHVVKKGDSLKSIAEKYQGDIEDIMAYNQLADASDITPGDTVVIPGGEVAIPVAEKKKTTTAKAGGSAPQGGSGYFKHPVPGAKRTQGIHGYNGVDLGAPIGTGVRAAAGGVVILARTSGYNGGYGKYVVIKHGNGTQTLYAHLSSVAVTSGESVSQGQTIGGVGNTGRSTGPHLHFEVRGAKNPF